MGRTLDRVVPSLVELEEALQEQACLLRKQRPDSDR